MAGLLAWQGWVTLSLFGPDRGWERLLNDEPIVSGSHPLHLYFGWLGASSFLHEGTDCCYDPAFQAGYPKTPVFDSGSRPAELFLALTGGGYSPAAYKIGLAFCCLAVPLLLWIGIRGVGLDRACSCLAVALGLVVWWGTPSRQMLEAGDLDFLLGGLAVVTVSGLLIRYHRAAGIRCYLELFAIASLGLFAHPFVFLTVVPLFLIYYLSVGPRHGFLWHLALVSSFGGAVAVNSFWLMDWARSWWLRVPLQLDSLTTRHRTLQTLWDSPLWGDPADRAVGIGLATVAAAGIVMLNQGRQRTAARVLGMGTGGLLGLVGAAFSWPSLEKLGTAQLLIVALWFSLAPGAYALVRVNDWLGHRLGSPWRGTAAMVLILGVAAGLGHRVVETLAARSVAATSLAVGLGSEREALLETLRAHTTADARILWEERSNSGDTSRWTALIPLVVDRPLLGGLGPELCIEHAFPTLVDQNLAGRRIGDWTDAELEQFCRRYNVGWAVCWSSVAIARMRAWKDAAEIVSVTDGGTGFLFRLRPHSFVLKGKARWIQADSHHITLADVVPEGGQVVLSLHYQAGMEAIPNRVHIEKFPDANDPIPLTVLQVSSPVTRLTLTWHSP
jgi:hypothetical protein